MPWINHRYKSNCLWTIQSQTITSSTIKSWTKTPWTVQPWTIKYWTIQYSSPVTVVEGTVEPQNVPRGVSLSDVPS